LRGDRDGQQQRENGEAHGGSIRVGLFFE
jgi:hypothetical protein